MHQQTLRNLYISVLLALFALTVAACGGSAAVDPVDKDALKNIGKGGVFSGRIDAIDDSSLTVDGTEFSIIDETQWRGPTNKNLEPSDFPVGTNVQVMAEQDGDSWIALVVKKTGPGTGVGGGIGNGGGGGEPVVETFEGIIAVLSPTQLTLEGGEMFSINDDTQFFNPDGTVGDPATFDSGDRVTVVARRMKLTWLAQSITLIEDVPGSLTIVGTIDSISDGEVVVDGAPFGINEESAFWHWDGTEADPAEFDEGDLVIVEASIENGEATVGNITLVDDNDTDPVIQYFTGNIFSISETELIVGADIFNLTAETQWILEDGTLGSSDDFGIMDEVAIFARLDGTEWTALQVKLVAQGGPGIP